MADAPPPTTSSPDAYPGTPGWIKLAGILVLLIVLVFGGLHLAGRGLGPGMHVPPAGGR